MTGAELRKARMELRHVWGWDRAPNASELGRAMGTTAKDAGELVRDCEARRDEPVPWYVESLVNTMLRGVLPTGGTPRRLYDLTVRRDRKSKRPRQAA